MRPSFPKHAIVTAGMPYGNKGLHFGHIAGVFVPADIYARFLRDRIGETNVLFISGTDCYGSPINEGYRKACEAGEFEGSLYDYVKKNHDAQAKTMKAYDISLDIYEGSALGSCAKIHEQVTDAFIRRLYEGGYLERRSCLQFYDEAAQSFLNGRQVEGHCPIQGCKSQKAYADECELGHQFMPEELIAPRSTLTGEVPVLKPVENWYFKLPLFESIINEYVELAARSGARPFALKTIREFLAPPLVYIKTEMQEKYQEIAVRLPRHTYTPPAKGKHSFSLTFVDIEQRDAAVVLLANAGIKYRTGKTLVPFRITGNVDWGVSAPELEDEGPHTVWCWPESLWAPISFSIAALRARNFSPDSWREWWCSDEAKVYQFIGQDNIYFYGVAQPALWAATQKDKHPCAQPSGQALRQTTLVPNYHILFMGKKASSSSDIKPPSADELLKHYTCEQLRAHWAALGLGLKPASFAPKYYDPKNVDNPKASDPVLKEGKLLTNIFNRIARSCFYTAQKYFDGAAPLGKPRHGAQQHCKSTVLAFEQDMYNFEIHACMDLMDGFLRAVNKWWTQQSKMIFSRDVALNDSELISLLRDAFYYLHVACVLMHPIVPRGTELIFEYFAIHPKNPGKAAHASHAGFFSWEHVFEPLDFWATPAERAAGFLSLKSLAPHYDFFERQPTALHAGV